MHYRADGTIEEVPYWLDLRLPEPVGTLNPYRRVEAETMAWGYGLRTDKFGIAGNHELVRRAGNKPVSITEQFPESTGKKNLYVYDLDEGEYIRLRSVDFSKKAARTFSITAAAASVSGGSASEVPAGATISIHLDAPGGPLLGTVEITSTGSVDTYKAFTTKLTPKLATGVRDLYFCIDRAKGDVRLDWWQFKK